MRAKFEPQTDGFNYNEFLEQLRNPAAKPVARTVKNFLVEFGRRPLTLGEQVRFIHDFLEFIAGKMKECIVWQHTSEREFENAREGMEKLVMNRLYPVCFSPAASDDADKDRVLREKMSLFRWIREEHLDIPHSAQNTAFLQFAKAELLKMNNFKSPRDKVICILNCCTVIYGLLKHMKGGSEDVGADRFLPLLIFVVITASPPKLVSNIQYISRFRSADRMQSEAGYYVTNLQCAVAFIESMDASCLSITQEEFDKNIEMTIWEIETEKRGNELSAQQKRAEREHQQHQQQQRRIGAVLPDINGERAQWLIDRSSDLAKSTIEKTNNFVGRLISELSTPNASVSGQSTPSGAGNPSPTTSQYPGVQATIQHRQHREASLEQSLEQLSDADGGEQLVAGTAEWGSALALVRDMFPNIDSEIVEIIFESNQGFVPKTIEQLLDISMDNEAREIANEQDDFDAALLDSPRIGVAGAPGDAQSDRPAAAAAAAAHAGSAAIADTTIDSRDNGGDDDGDAAVDEVERWKDRWADDDSSDGEDGENGEAEDEPDSDVEQTEQPGSIASQQAVATAAMSMFGRFDKDLKHADGCLHKAADMFFHPLGEDIFHKWDTNHPAFPGPKLTKVRVECKEKEAKCTSNVEEKKEQVKVTVKVDEKKEAKCEDVKVSVKVDEKTVSHAHAHAHAHAHTHTHGHAHHHHHESHCHDSCHGSCHSGCHGSCHSHCDSHCHSHTHTHSHCHQPVPAPPKHTSWRIYPCYKAIDKYAVVESEWSPTMKDYQADKLWQLHVYLPGVAKDKVSVDIIENTVVVHGQGISHTHCGMWPEHVEHCCNCTRKEQVSFCKQYKLPDRMNLDEAHVEFEADVMVIRIHRR
ncbi:hypothetical protein GGI12_004225 [Dipsacomyces acuminosporus]|nr:hypothetical protein GGI12_004225 [Dipsacomyces acuminosporus]